MGKLKVLYYINQFYAGIGGEEKAHVGLQEYDGAKGPASGLVGLWQGKMEVVKTIACGDNFINNDDNFATLADDLKRIVDDVQPDVFVAGPAFNAGRYGVACAKMADYMRSELNIPSVTAMYNENPAVEMYIKDNYIIATPETAAGMPKVLPVLAAFALKLAKGEKIGPARFEGYLPRGYRYNEWHEKTGAVRVVEMLLNKLRGEEWTTEVPLRGFDTVKPAPALKSVADKKIALVTTGGLVPKGNPDKLKQAFSTSYASYDISDLATMPADQFESIHGGFDTTKVNEDPNRVLPLDQLRQLKEENIIGDICDRYFITAGVGTNIKASEALGKGIAEELLQEGVHAVVLTST